MTEEIRVRYAPSPTGHLHIGNARTAIFNWLFARHYNGKFIIRIEDTDTARNIADGEKSQLDNLAWLGLDWDESPENPGEYGPYRQSERNEQGLYQPFIDELLAKGLAYKSYKTTETIAAEREAQQAAKQAPHYVYEYEGLTSEEREAKYAEFEAQGLKAVVRFRVPEEKVYAWDDIVKGHIEIGAKEVGGDWVIQKTDGMPTYNFAVVVDDHLMKISHVLRGDDHVSNTPKQIMIFEALGWNVPKFGHMALIINGETGKKLSKRDENLLQFVEQYHELGYQPQAMVNFIGLLGWSPKGEDEIFSLESFKQMFDETRLSKANAKFDQKKLEWINNQWMRRDLDQVMPQLIQELVNANLVSEADAETKKDWLAEVIKVAGVEGISYTREVVALVRQPFFELGDMTDEMVDYLTSDDGRKVFSAWESAYTALPESATAEDYMNTIRSIQNTLEIKGRNLWNPIRIATTHEIQGPNLPEMLVVMDKKTILSTMADIKATYLN
ncbi:glutamate--tRNA ligase [Leuconostoc gasicomitatum]|uniref:Glutamate--tRNA ligase n=2 Tax=Leuconostoc TaxID=1243 RepID=A0AAN2UHA4_9LACO|nr:MULTISPECIES: glutamate--tRNA ligase [Leuconostoc]MBZ5947409.1 glutamate--tRNA ligase [Leuconostoc gasicomitatum]MBZ5956939.1 glutamate--tRNA ligase [Leuconostoc gasicomitatum]MBZ5958325.1 glutamate--tRNA ligase [Leuconostoc gasicomitatum]MBZ5960565.1 glutamate--tRNA ligase [Leuconostoc gasicomitatum]MBZ5965289.1 glutamate--tRNA ligase [Leuconostoc gasicomitatum]